LKNVNDFNREAEYYDLLEAKNQPLFDSIINFLTEVFVENNVKNILDITCGTGAQSIPLSQKGFTVVGSDIAENLIEIAKLKSKCLSNIIFYKGDVRHSKFGEFDAVISMLNSLGYLTKSDFKKALVNINKNLRLGGLLVFDNTNKDCLNEGNFITDKIIDTAGENNGIKFVRFSKSEYNNRTGIINTKWDVMIQKGYITPIKKSGVWRRQTYSVNEIRNIFNKTGFKLEQIYDRTLDKFEPEKSFSYLIIGRKERSI
jgi:2-polyprenyl-3-methyl-5-hydroxy-6-metoxy-1,4-benzoquinol methylase